MRIINILIFIPILLIGCNKNNKIQTIDTQIEDVPVFSMEINEQEDLNKIMYVNSPEGLRVRELPSINGNRIGLLDYLTEVKIIKEDNTQVNIEGITGKWVYIITPIEGWVFSGFLEDEKIYRKRLNKSIDAPLPNSNEYKSIGNIEEKIVGRWLALDEYGDGVAYPVAVLIFRDGGRFQYGRYETGGGWSGEWKYENGIIILEGRWGSESDYETGEYINNAVYETKYLTDIKCYDEDNMILYNGISETLQKIRRYEEDN